MSSRDDILASIRTNLPRVDRPLPPVPLFDDDPPASLLSAFKDNLHRMGGVFLDPPTFRARNKLLDELIEKNGRDPKSVRGSEARVMSGMAEEGPFSRPERLGTRRRAV